VDFVSRSPSQSTAFPERYFEFDQDYIAVLILAAA
jgi:hypothetical protein